MSEEKFVEELKKIGITPTPLQLKQLSEYYKLLVQWNKKMNLTRIISEEDVYLKHFFDSLTISKVVDFNKVNSLLDFGTGAGFPGLVLKIFYPDVYITLVDSLNKRIVFLNEVISKLGLKKIVALHSRIEDVSIKHYDIITTRAVANLSKLLLYTSKLIDKDTLFVPMKSHVDSEIFDAKSILDNNHLKIIDRCEFNLPIEESLRNILVIKKD